MRRPRPTLPAPAWWLLVISGIFTLSIGLSNTFVNIYLWKVDRSYTSIGWYNFALYCLMPIAFVGAGALAKRRHPVVTLRVGVALHGLFYALVLIGGARLAHHPFLPGVVMGIAAGFYWLSFNWLSLMFTGANARDRFYGLNGVAGAVAGMVAPTVAGFLIAQEDRFGRLTGYHLIFGLSLALFGVATVVSLKLRARTVSGRLHPKAALTAIRHNPLWRATLIGCTVYGTREGVFLFLVGLLIYVATGSELELGEFLLLQSALSFGSFYLVGRFTTAANRLRVMGFGAVGMACAALLFVWPISATRVLWYGSLVAVFLPLFLVPLQGAVFNQIGAMNEAGDNYVEHIIAREAFENLGRVIGVGAFLVLMWVRPGSRSIGWFAVCLGFVQLLTWLSIRIGRAQAATGTLRTVSTATDDAGNWTRMVGAGRRKAR